MLYIVQAYTIAIMLITLNEQIPLNVLSFCGFNDDKAAPKQRFGSRTNAITQCVYLFVCLFIYSFICVFVYVSLCMILSPTLYSVYFVCDDLYIRSSALCFQQHSSYHTHHSLTHSLATFHSQALFFFVICYTFNYVEHQLTLILNWPLSTILPFIFPQLIRNSFCNTWQAFALLYSANVI